MKKLTIFTPTYNRSEYLKILYKSILKNSEYLEDIIWLIIDDGSRDNTKEVVDKFIKDGKVDINYILKENGGKYKALNSAIKIVDTPFFVCIDSDDYLLEGGLEEIFKYIDSDDNSIGAIYPYCSKKTNEMNFDYLVGKMINISDMKFVYNNCIETTIVFKSKYIKETYFIENEEKFQSEEVLYNKLISKGKFLFINEFVVGGEYLDTGLTKNIYKLWFDNFNNTILLFSSRYEYLNNNMRFGFSRMKEKIKCVINKNSICMAKKISIYKYSDNKFLSTILYLPSLLYKYIKYDKRGLKYGKVN